MKVRNGGTVSSTNSVLEVSRTSGRPPMSDKIEDADGAGMAGFLVTWLELARIVWVERRAGFVEVGRVRSALGGNSCANTLTRSIALSSRLNLEVN